MRRGVDFTCTFAPLTSNHLLKQTLEMADSSSEVIQGVLHSELVEKMQFHVQLQQLKEERDYEASESANAAQEHDEVMQQLQDELEAEREKVAMLDFEANRQGNIIERLEATIEKEGAEMRESPEGKELASLFAQRKQEKAELKNLLDVL